MEIDVSKKVMKQVVRLEKQRVFWWSSEFLITTLILGLIAVILLWWVSAEFLQNQTWQLLTLFTGDWETIREFWKDSILVFWQELPQSELILGLTAGLILLVLFIITRKKRIITWRKINQLIKYH